MAKDIPLGTSNKISKMSLLCAFFVVCIHCQPTGEINTLTYWFCNLFNTGICRVAVPFFFLIAGYFLAKHINENGWWKREVFKRTKTLLIPYFVWSFIYSLYTTSFIIIANILANETLLCNVRSNFLTTLNLSINPFNLPHLIPLWFIRCLFLFIFVSPILVWLLKQKTSLRTIFLVFLFPLGMFQGPFIEESNNLLWGSIGTGGIFSLVNLFYFALGIYLCLHPIKISFKKSFIISIGGLGVALLILRVIATINNPAYGFYLRCLSIPCNLFFIWSILSTKPWPRFLTKTSFPIYIFHIFFLTAIGIIGRQIQLITTTSIVGSLTACVIAFVGSILLSSWLHKYFPKLSSFLFGGR